MSDSTQQQMIYDLIDGQLSADQMQQAQQLIAENVELAELYESLRDQQTALRAMPKFELDSDFANRVVRAAQAEGLLEEPTTTSPLKLAPSTNNRNWWAPAMAITALAAMLLVTLFIIPNLPTSSTIAQVDNQPEANSSVEKDKDNDDGSLAEAAEFDASQHDAADPKQLRSAANSAQQESDGAMKVESGGASNPSNTMADSAQSEAMSDDAAPGMTRGQRGGAGRGGNLMPMVERFPPSNPNGNGIARMMMAKRETTENRVLVFRVPEKEAAIREINKAFSENGIIVGLPETVSQRMARSDNKNLRIQDNAVAESGGVEKREFAYRIQTTPAQMQKAVLALRNQTEIVAVDSTSRDRGLTGDALPLAMAQNSIQAPAENLVQESVQGQELRIQNFGSAKMRGAAPRQGSEEGGGNSDIESQVDGGTAGPEENGDIARAPGGELRSINEYFGLATGVDEADLTPQSYTLIFMLDDGVAESNPTADALESDAAPPAAPDKNDQLP